MDSTNQRCPCNTATPVHGQVLPVITGTEVTSLLQRAQRPSASGSGTHTCTMGFLNPIYNRKKCISKITSCYEPVSASPRRQNTTIIRHSWCVDRNMEPGCQVPLEQKAAARSRIAARPTSPAQGAQGTGRRSPDASANTKQHRGFARLVVSGGTTPDNFTCAPRHTRSPSTLLHSTHEP